MRWRIVARHPQPLGDDAVQVVRMRQPHHRLQPAQGTTWGSKDEGNSRSTVR
jgi:hypothetical protein